jgi:hypothetical protein
MDTGRSKHASTQDREHRRSGPPVAGRVVKAVDRYLTAIAAVSAGSALTIDEDAELDFVRYADLYARSNGISCAAWIAVGVSAAVLERAGIKP